MHIESQVGLVFQFLLSLSDSWPQGNVKYYNRAVEAVKSFNTYLKASLAFSPITDVNNKYPGRFDSMESFWFAEVLKYV